MTISKIKPIILVLAIKSAQTKAVINSLADHENEIAIIDNLTRHMSVVEVSKDICKTKLTSLFMNNDNFSVEIFTDYNKRRATIH